MKENKIVSSRLAKLKRIAAFTLIELLVVVGLIGLFASLGIAAFNVARMNGAYTASKVLDHNFNNNLGDSLVLQLLMDEGMPDCSGNVTGSLMDSSGYGHNGTPGSPAPAWSADTPFGTGCSVNFGGTSYVDIANNAAVGLTSWTVSMWIKTTDTSRAGQSLLGGDYTTTATLELKGTKFGVYANTNNYFGSISVAAGKWVFVVATVDATSNQFRTYVNGVLDASQTGVAPVLGMAGRASIPVGANWAHGEYFYGAIDNIRIYDRALDTSEIQKLYAMGALKHGYAFVGDISPLAR